MEESFEKVRGDNSFSKESDLRKYIFLFFRLMAVPNDPFKIETLIEKFSRNREETDLVMDEILKIQKGIGPSKVAAVGRKKLIDDEEVVLPVAELMLEKGMINDGALDPVNVTSFESTRYISDNHGYDYNNDDYDDDCDNDESDYDSHDDLFFDDQYEGLDPYDREALYYENELDADMIVRGLNPYDYEERSSFYMDRFSDDYDD